VCASANSRQSELINVESWSRVNNLRVNPTKYAEIVFMDKRRKTTLQLPQPMRNVARVSVIKILGITFTNHLSVAEHVQRVINSSAQTLYALRTLHAHGMDDATLQTVFRSVIIAKLTYASSAWWGFATTTDRQRLQAFIRRSLRSRFVPPSLPPLDELCRSSVWRQTVCQYHQQQRTCAAWASSSPVGCITKL